MKILIGTNTFGNYHRQNVAVDSWKFLKEKFHDQIDIIDIQFRDEKNTFKNNYNLDVKFDLTRSSLDVLNNAEKKLPFVNDIFNAISNYISSDEDYFIFTNSDVIINSNLINYINDNKPECFACSRLDIQNISSYQNIKKEIKPVRWEIAGFDTFIMKKAWFSKYKHLFNDYLLGKPEFDYVYAFIMKMYGDNTPFGNQAPPFCFHIHHGNSSVTTACPEREHNRNILHTNSFDLLIAKLMFQHLKTNLIKRQPWGAFLYPTDDEKIKENEFFQPFNINYIQKF